jgi:hypothetical protein
MKGTLPPPFYILRSQEICWKFRQPTDVIDFAAGAATPHDEEDEVDEILPQILKDIENTPLPFQFAAAPSGARYEKRYSRAVDMEADCWFAGWSLLSPFRVRNEAGGACQDPDVGFPARRGIHDCDNLTAILRFRFTQPSNHQSIADFRIDPRKHDLGKSV